MCMCVCLTALLLTPVPSLAANHAQCGQHGKWHDKEDVFPLVHRPCLQRYLFHPPTVRNTPVTSHIQFLHLYLFFTALTTITCLLRIITANWTYTSTFFVCALYSRTSFCCSYRGQSGWRKTSDRPVPLLRKALCDTHEVCGVCLPAPVYTSVCGIT